MSALSVLGSCRSVDDYEKVARIGEGTYGTVYLAKDKTSNRQVALKRTILHNEESDGFPMTSIREIICLKRCQAHINCVQLLDIVVGKNRESVFLVFEYCEHDLMTLTNNVAKPFTETEVKTLIRQLLSAIKFLHNHWIVHRDIKVRYIDC